MLPFFESKTTILQSRRKTEYFEFPLHMHIPPELIYVNAGELTINYMNTSYQMTQGDFALIFPYITHGYAPSAHPCNYTLAIGAQSTYADYQQFLFQYHPTNPIVRQKDLPKDIPLLMNELVLLNDQEEESLLIKAIYSLILARTLPLLELKPNPGTYESNMILRAITYVSENFTETITLDTAATALGISKYDVSRLFSSAIKMTFVKYVNFMRISYAIELLEQTRHSVLHIALQSGFDTLRTFNRVFKAHTNMTPMQYRKEYNTLH